MQQRAGEIDESIKVNSWGSDPPLSSPTSAHHQTFFQHYAAQPSSPSPPPPPPPIGKDYSKLQSQQVKEVPSMEYNFARLKNEQIQKLRNLKSEYDQIKKITTAQYINHRMPSQQGSLRSSNAYVPSQTGSKVRQVMPSGRQYQILELEKKQLEIMLQNSMKKIEELLHNEMQYKKTIHELKLQKESKTYQPQDFISSSKTSKAKERQYYDQIRVLQLERETLLPLMTSLKEKIKYLQSKVNTSEQQLRKMLEEKRNYEELIRMEKDKLLNLEIELRREKRQHEIMEKDKNAEINMLLKERDLKESYAQKELRNLTTSLQEELKLKDKRYNLLLQQLESIKNDKQKEEKEQEVKLVNEILSKNNPDGSNKVLQDTITNILTRLNELETKPTNFDLLEEIEQEEKKYQEQYDQANDSAIIHYKEQIDKLENKVLEYQRKIASLKTNNQILEGENTSLRAELEAAQRKAKNLQTTQLHLRQQLDTLKIIQRKMSTTSSREVLRPLQQPTLQESTHKYEFLTLKMNNLEKDVESLQKKLEQSEKEVQKVENQNRELLNKVSRAEFERATTKQESDFQLNLAKKAHETNYNILLQDLQHEKSQNSKAQQQIHHLKGFIRDHMQAGRRQIARLNFKIEALQREKNSFDLQLKTNYNNDLQKIKSGYKDQIDQLTSEVKDLNSMNKTLQEQYNRSQYLINENEELKHSIKTMRLDQNYNSPSRSRQQEADRDGDIMTSIAQQFGGGGSRPQSYQNTSYHDQNVINSIFGNGAWLTKFQK